MRSMKSDLEEKLRIANAQAAEIAANSDDETVKQFVALQKEKVCSFTMMSILSPESN